MRKKIRIGSFEINHSSRPFIIAELSANHGGSIDLALESVRAAKRSGADCIKIQTYTPDTITIDSDNDDFLIKGTIWDGEKLYDLYKKAYTPWEWHEKIFQEAAKNDLICFSSPFDKTAVDLLENLNVPAYKIASFEITDVGLIDYVAKKNKPVLISTGVASQDDIQLALKTCYDAGNEKVILLKCTSSYPAPIEEANLCMINEFNNDYKCFCGLSDHTEGYIAPVVATSLGAKVIEKHFIIDKSIGGPDASFSLDEKDFKLMVKNVLKAHNSIGNRSYSLTDKQIKGRDFSRSLYFIRDLKKGSVISHEDIKSVRPGFGLHPKFMDSIIGKTVKVDVKKASRVSLDKINL